MKRDKTAGSMGSSFSANLTRLEAVHLLFGENLDLLQVAANEWVETPDEKLLHEYRIALRRVRVLLRVFVGDIESHGGRPLRLVLSRVADKLGRVRDLDVMMLLVRKSDFRRNGRNDFEVDLLMKAIKQEQNSRLLAVQKHMAGASWAKTGMLTQQFKERLSDKNSPGDSETIRTFLDHEFNRHRQRIMRAASNAESDHPEILHSFRIILRRLRYLGDFFAGIADAEQRKVFKQVHRIEQELGKIHDIDLALEFLQNHPLKAPTRLGQEWRTIRSARIEKFRKKWAKCHRKLGRLKQPD